MKTSLLRKNQKGFTLIEIIAVLVILGILAAVAIPKYLDMREESVINAAKGAVSELNARERLSLAKSKLIEEQAITIYSVPADIGYNLGGDWSGLNTNLELVDLTGDVPGSAAGDFKGVNLTFTKLAGSINSPAQWSVAKTP